MDIIPRNKITVLLEEGEARKTFIHSLHSFSKHFFFLTIRCQTWGETYGYTEAYGYKDVFPTEIETQ